MSFFFQKDRPQLGPDAVSSKDYFYIAWSFFFLALVFTGYFILLYKPIADGDIWFHILYGKYILEHKTLIVDHTLFSWTPTDNDYIYVAWIPQIIYYFFYDLFGTPSIFAIRFIVCFGFFSILLFYLLKNNLFKNPIAWLIFLLSLVLSQYASYDKAEIFSFLYYYTSVFLYWHIRDKKNYSPYIFLVFPLIMLIWVNSHGGFIFGLAFYFTIIIGEIFNILFLPHIALENKYRKWFFISMFLSFLTPAINPYGISYPVQLFNDIILAKLNKEIYTTIAAYRPTFDKIDFANYYHPNLALIILLVLLLINLMKKNVNFSILTTNLLFAFLYAKFVRLSFFWGPVFFFSAIILLKNTDYFRELSKKNLKLISYSICSILILISISYSTYFKVCMLNFSTQFALDTGIYTPEEETEYIKNNLMEYRIGNSYVVGSYLLLKLWPEKKVMFDPRQFPYHKMYHDYLDNFQQTKDAKGFLKRYPAEILVIELNYDQLLSWLITSPDWKLLYYGPKVSIFIRSDLSVPIDKYGVAKSVNKMTNFRDLDLLFLLTLNFNDYETARSILERMEKLKYSCKDLNDIYNASKYHLEAKIAFINGDYENSVKYFDTVGHEVIKNMLLHSHACLLLAQKKWKENQFIDAFKEMIKSANLYGGNYNVYNMGVMSWYILKTQDVSVLSEQEKKLAENWKTNLEKFLKAGGMFISDPLAGIAQDILNDRYVGKPPLSDPPINKTCYIP